MKRIPVTSDDIPPSSVLLVLGGEIPAQEIVRALVRAATIVVAADAGALLLEAMGLLPSVIIGDLDSVGTRVAEFQSRGVEIVLIENQEETDFEKSLRWIRDAGYPEVAIIGCGGRLIDHTLNNFSVLGRWGSRLRMSVIDQETVAYVVAKEVTLRVGTGRRVSLIGLPEASVTTRGLVWELHGETIRFGERDGASNRSSTEVVSIDVINGVVLAVVPHTARPIPA